MSWQFKSLDELIMAGKVSLHRGNIISKRDIDANPGEYPIYSSATKNNGTFGYYGSYMFDEELITWSVDGGGHLFYRPKHKFSVTNVGGILRVRDHSYLDVRFLHLALDDLHSRVTFDWSRKAHPSVIRLVYNQIPIPPLEEQRRIVETIDGQISRIDKALTELELAAKRSHHLFLAALEQAIDECGENTYQPLQDCLKFIDQKKKVQRGWSPQCLSHPRSDSKCWAVLKTTAVQSMRYEPQHNKELPKTLEPKAHLEVQDGDFLMTTTGPRNRCGIVCRVVKTPQRIIFSGKILRFHPDSAKIQPAWLELVLNSQRYQRLLDQLKVGSSDSSVSIGNVQVLELKVPVPSVQDQKRLVGEIERMKELAAMFELEIDQEAQKFMQLRRSLLHEACSET